MERTIALQLPEQREGLRPINDIGTLAPEGKVRVVELGATTGHLAGTATRMGHEAWVVYDERI